MEELGSLVQNYEDTHPYKLSTQETDAGRSGLYGPSGLLSETLTPPQETEVIGNKSYNNYY